ncbi:MAG: FAD-dependent oxidoreductase [Candidatus Zipacnadales bacterium]
MAIARIVAGVDWPLLGTYEVVVAGAGPAGIGAACGAAKLGARTLLIERYGFPGGVATVSCCPHLMGFAAAGRQIIAGVADELVRELADIGQAAFRLAPQAVPDPEPIGDRPLLTDIITSIEGIRLAANRLFARHGIKKLFYTSVIGATVQGDRVIELLVDRIDGPGRIRAQTFVDATGDADSVFRATGNVREAPVEESLTKTILIRVGGVVGFDRRMVEKAFDAHVAAGTVPFPTQDRFMGMALLNPGEVLLNFTLTAGDGLSAYELTRMDEELREQIPSTVAWFRRAIPGFAGCFLVDSAIHVGVRCGRRIVGLETITMSDIDANTAVREPVALGGRSYGGHGLDRFLSPWAKSQPGLRGIPWRALLPVGLENVAVGGRSISCEHWVIDTIRLMACCMATGQAAGVSAALAAQQGQTIVEVGYRKVREALLAQGAILE